MTLSEHLKAVTPAEQVPLVESTSLQLTLEAESTVPIEEHLHSKQSPAAAPGPTGISLLLCSQSLFLMHRPV